MSDSPTWKRGKTSRSNSATFSPPAARKLAALDPPGPPPMTTTSYEVIWNWGPSRRALHQVKLFTVRRFLSERWERALVVDGAHQTLRDTERTVTAGRGDA